MPAALWHFCDLCNRAWRWIGIHGGFEYKPLTRSIQEQDPRMCPKCERDLKKAPK